MEAAEGERGNQVEAPGGGAELPGGERAAASADIQGNDVVAAVQFGGDAVRAGDIVLNAAQLEADHLGRGQQRLQGDCQTFVLTIEDNPDPQAHA